MTAYQPEQWHDMFVAMAGAAAALTGLIFVAVSINLEQVLKHRALPPRAVETLSISVLVRGGGGLYWLVAELILGFVGSVVNAWILLVEIHR
jgi:hypothetical protein